MMHQLIRVAFILAGSFFACAGNLYAEGIQYSGEGMTLLQLLKTGGVSMWVIILVSLLMLGLAIFCFIWLKPKRFMPDDLRRMIQEQVTSRRFKEAFLLCERQQVPFCRIVLSGLKTASVFSRNHLKDSTVNFSLEVFYLMETVRKSIEAAGVRETEKIRTLVQWFNNIGVLAPMLGLLGTVVGMIHAFSAIAYKTELGKPVLLSSAISQAMVNTAGGLIVGITCMMFYYYFSGKAALIMADMEAAAEALTEEMELALRQKGEEIKGRQEK